MSHLSGQLPRREGFSCQHDHRGSVRARGPCCVPLRGNRHLINRGHSAKLTYVLGIDRLPVTSEDRARGPGHGRQALCEGKPRTAWGNASSGRHGPNGHCICKRNKRSRPLKYTDPHGPRLSLSSKGTRVIKKAQRHTLRELAFSGIKG